MKYKFPNGLTIELGDNEKVIAERYGAEPVKEAKAKEAEHSKDNQSKSNKK